MPAPRAVLNDILDLKLDPKKAHKSTSKKGRLSPKDVFEKKPVEKPGLVFIDKIEEPPSKEESSSKPEEIVAAESETLLVVTKEEQAKEEVSENVKLINQPSEKSKKKQQYQRKNSYNN